MINGGSIITLQRILGHARIEQTMAYVSHISATSQRVKRDRVLKIFRCKVSVGHSLLNSRVKPDLPTGQATHALRHSFATHFMINGGSIITLQRILSHISATSQRVKRDRVLKIFRCKVSVGHSLLNSRHNVHRWVISYGFQWSCVPRNSALYR
jgi:integrase